MSAKQQTTRRPAAKKAAKKAPRKPAKGYMGKNETVPLAIAARKALDYQIHLGNEEEGTDFKTWRHAQVKSVTGRDGLKDSLSGDFQKLLSHFKLLAGKDPEAFDAEMKVGKEKRVQLAYEICRNLQDHILLADRSWPELLAVFADDGRDDKWINKAMARKLHIEQQGGPIREGYLVSVVRGKTGRQNLTLGNNLVEGLADRCSEKQLKDVLSTIVNRINAKEGVGSTGRRNRKQASGPAKAARSVKTLAPRPQEPTSTVLDLPPGPRAD